MGMFKPGQEDGPFGKYAVTRKDIGRLAGYAAVGLVVAAVIFFWSFCRINVGKGEFVPLLKKTGQDISNDDVLAPRTGDYKGPQFEILREGRHFRNPWTWYWSQTQQATVIPPLKVGVLTRRYGEPLTPGQIIAETEKQKGIVAKPLGPGRHYVNLWAYDVQIEDMVKVEPGFHGVVTRLVGKLPADANVFVVEEGERGTQPFLLKAGTHPDYSNPHVYLVRSIDVRSHKFEMSEQYGITFPSKYGFDIKVEGTIEWAPNLKMLPELFVKYVDRDDLKASGGIDNIQRKIILPFARSYFRTIGGQHRAVDYITGDTRIIVQDEVEKRLRESCAKEGIDIRSFVIRAAEPPTKIREQYERREIALREIDQYAKEREMEIGTAVLDGAKPKLDADGKPVVDERGNPVLVGGTPRVDSDGKPIREGGRLAKVIQERQKDRETKLGEARAGIATIIRGAQKYEATEVTQAQKKLAVAKIMLEAAKDQAAKILVEGEAKAKVTVMKHTAEASAVQAKVKAFKTGEKYAENQLILKFSPGIGHILSDTEGLFAKLFERFAKIQGATTTTAPKKD